MGGGCGLTTRASIRRGPNFTEKVERFCIICLKSMEVSTPRHTDQLGASPYSTHFTEAATHTGPSENLFY